MTRVLVVDDERPALEDLGRLLERTGGVEEVVLADGAAEALRLLAGDSFDVVFMDVRMPGIDGLELARTLERFAEPPALIFVSAYEGGAVSVFEHGLAPLDFLVKPVSRARVEQALERAQADDPRRRGRAGGQRATGPEDRLAVDQSGEIVPVEHQRGGATRLLDRSSVLFVRAEGDYVRIHADSGRFLMRGALSEIEERWAQHGFVRVHRSYVANLRRAVEIRPALGGAVTIVMADGSEIPVARRHVAELRRRLRM